MTGQIPASRLLRWLTAGVLLTARGCGVGGRNRRPHRPARNGQDARHITDFRKIQPLNGEPASLPTEAWILATPEGLAVAFRNTSRPRCRAPCSACSAISRSRSIASTSWSTSTAITAPATTSRVSSTDGIFDAIVTNEKQFNEDWDGNWRHAVGGDDEGWTVEVLIPWHIAPMRERRRRQAHDRRSTSTASSASTGERAALAVRELRALALPVRLRAASRCTQSTASRCSR